MRSTPAAAALPSLLLALAAGCSRNSEASPQAPVAGTVQKHEATRVRTEPAERREMVRVLSTTTTVVSEQEVDIVPKASGVVTSVTVEQGDRVKAGDVLAVLDQRETQLAVQDAQVALRESEDSVARAEIAEREAKGMAGGMELTYESARRKCERNEKAGLVSEQDLEQLRMERDSALSSWENAKLAAERATAEIQAARTAVERARISLQQAEVAHSHTEVRAPYDGVIDARMVHVGGTAAAGQPAFVLADDANLRAIIHRPQRELALFTRGASAGDSDGAVDISASAEALPGLRFEGAIERISPSIDPDSGSFAVWIHLEPAEDGTVLLPGMLLRLEIAVERHADALVVPKRALRREGDTTILFRVRERTGQEDVVHVAERVVVREGFDQDALVEVSPEISEGLVAGDQVIVVGNRDLEDGDEVLVAAEETGAGESETEKAQTDADETAREE